VQRFCGSANQRAQFGHMTAVGEAYFKNLMSQHGCGCTIVRVTSTNQRATSSGADSSSFKFENMLMQQYFVLV